MLLFQTGLRATILAWWAALASTEAQTVTNAPGALGLAEARQLALEHNWDLLAARSGLAAAQAQLLVAQEFPNPSLSASSAKLGARDNATTSGNGLWARNYDTVLAVNQLLEIGGKRHDRQAAARAGVLGAKARFLDARRTLDQGVTKAYVAALLAEANAQVWHDSASAMRHEQAIAESRFKAGDIAESDLNQIQVAAEQYVLQEAAAAAAAVPARTAVELLLGITCPAGTWHPADSFSQVEAATVSEIPGRAQAPRPDVLAAKSDVRAAEANLALAKAQRIPDPTLAVQYEHNPPGGGPPADTLGVGISFPLPLWNQNQGAIGAAQAEAAQARLAYAKLEAQMRSDLVVAEATFGEASARCRRYQEQIVPQSAAARAAVAFKYEKGSASLVDLLEAQRTDNDVRLAAAQSQADAASSAADLKAARTGLTDTELNLLK